MYSLTKATEVLIKHYHLGNLNISDNVLKYNSHKIRHSNGVLETGRNLIIKINENIKLSKEVSNRAEIIFLLHDLGRFYQNDKIKVLPDSEFEHGDKGYEIAKIEGYDEKICLAIKYHNKYNLDNLFNEKNYINMENEDKSETLLLSKLIRDVDKLQNMIYGIYDIKGLINFDKNLSKGDFSGKIIEQINKKVTIDRSYIKTYADNILSILFWIYDINFKESIEMLNFYLYFEKIINEIENLEGVKNENINIIKKAILDFNIKI